MATGQKTKVTLLYDLISPWSYIAFCLLKRYEKKWNLDIVLQPVALGYVFQASGNRPPLIVRNKGRMMMQEFRMMSDYYEINTSPDAWTFSEEAQQKPPNSLPLMRFMRVLQEEKPQLLETATIKLFNRIFAEGDSTVFSADADKLLSVLGPDMLHTKTLADMLATANGKDSKERIKTEAKHCVEKLGAYGVPWMTFEKPDGATKEFMGSDRFELIANWLGMPYQAGKLKSAGWEHSKL